MSNCRNVTTFCSLFIYDVTHFPNVVGYVDCNRKGFYSVNVQVVGNDDDSRITHVVARWKGSIHDSRIWNNCTLKDDFEHGRKTCILLGDSGYACTPYMFTPLLNTHNAAEEAYNRAHKATRVTVECCFGRNLVYRVKVKFVVGLKPGAVLDRPCEESLNKSLKDLFSRETPHEVGMHEVVKIQEKERKTRPEGEKRCYRLTRVMIN